jgi:cell division protein FtsI (penicillin-binding protein 3)
VVTGVLALWVAGIEARLIYLQIVARDSLVARAERQQNRTIKAPAKRGEILDRRGRVLATSADADSVFAVPSDVTDATRTVAELCRALRDCTPRERQMLLDRLGAGVWSWVRRQVSTAEAERLAALKLDGIGFLKESRRFYPKNELAAHLLGYVGIDNKGLAGIESAYDAQIRGKDGTILIQTDARQRAFSRVEQSPTAGSSLELTIDENLQYIAERELAVGVRESKAIGGTAVVMDPRTGEILAMANEPTFDPNVYREAKEIERRNRAVQDVYEPGSTFKVVTASAAIEEKVIPIDTLIDTSPGVIRIGGRVIDEFAGHNYGVLSFGDVIVKSSNIGAIKIGMRVGTRRLNDYVHRFGFGRPVSPDFPGESPGIVWSADKWTESALASVSMGYQVAVTPLQMVAAVSAVANGGELVEPRVVRAVYVDNRRQSTGPKVLRRAISPSTAKALTTIMEGVVERGTARLAQIPGYTVAGKTGTASKLINGRYSASENNVSFVGFAPSRDPALAIIVMVDTPHAGSRTGGMVSAPIFKRIAAASLRYLDIPPGGDKVPPVLIARHESPQPSSMSRRHDPVVSVVSTSAERAMPDVLGLSARDAVRQLASVGLAARMSGDGVVVAQNPMPGALVHTGGVGQLKLGRANAVEGPAVEQP